MNIERVEKFTAIITIGKAYGYSSGEYSLEELHIALQEHQNKRIREKNIYLSTFVYQGDIVMSGQIEPHYRLELINYPRFPLDKKVFKDEVTKLAKHLARFFKQNRLVIVFHNEIVMLEENKDIDPRINSNER